MTKLLQPSVFREFLAAMREAGTVYTHSAAACKEQYEEVRAHVEHEWSLATPQECYATGANGLDGLIRHLNTPFLNGDSDLLEAYVKFSVFKNPSLPLAVTNLRFATGKNKVIDILTKEHLDIHDRIVHVFKDLISGGDATPKKVLDRKFNKLAVFAFTNMDHADDILRIAETRKLITPKDIAAVLENESVMSPLMEGVL